PGDRWIDAPKLAYENARSRGSLRSMTIFQRLQWSMMQWEDSKPILTLGIVSEDVSNKEAGTSGAEPSAQTNVAASGADVAPVAPLNRQANSGLGFLLSPTWWRGASLASWLFAPQCILPAAIWTASGVVTALGGWFASVHMSGIVSAGDLFIACGALLITLPVCGALLIWGLGLWLLRLTAYARSFDLLPIGTLRVPDRQTIIAAQKKAQAELPQRQTFFLWFWLIVTGIVLPAGLVWFVSIMTIMAQMKELTGQQLYTLPAPVNNALYAMIGFLSVVLSEISLVALIVSANSTRGAMDAAKESLALSFKAVLPGIILTIIFVVVNTIVATPQIFTSLSDPMAVLLSARSDIKILLVGYFWQGVSSVVILTLTLSPFCEYFRGRVK
ncbi:MAG: hypothetical protein ACRD3W_30865, partial [Terriglobales bacterium]